MKTIKIKTSDLTGAALDWAVAKCLGVHAEAFRLFYEPIEPTDYDSHGYPEFHYSTIWSQGGPIIEREKLCVGFQHQFDSYLAPEIDLDVLCWARTTAGGYLKYGPTPLIAAMRAFVASQLGDDVEIPTDLANSNN